MNDVVESPQRDDRLEAIREVFDREIEPLLESHLGGGRVAGIDDNGVVEVEFTGACTACTYRRNTIIGAIYPRLKHIDGVTGVTTRGVAVTIRQQQRVSERFADYRSRAEGNRSEKDEGQQWVS
jgi:Fe-S cluster biogenesis protein NfuA